MIAHTILPKGLFGTGCYRVLRWCFIFGWFFFSVLTLMAQVRTLSLDEAITIACDSSLSAHRARNTFLTNYWGYRSYRAGRLPSLGLSLVPFKYDRSFTSRYDYSSNRDVYRLQQSLYSYGNMSLQQNVDATGGTLYIDSELGYFRNFGNSSYQQFSSVPMRMGYSQSLIGYNNFKWEKRIEPVKYQKAQRTLLYTMGEISETVAGYFFSLAMARVEYELATSSLASSDTLYQMGMERQQIASISQADLLTLKLDWINAGNSFKNAEIKLKKALFSLLNFLNMGQKTDLNLELPSNPTVLDISADRVLSMLRTNNPDYLTNRQSLLEAEQTLEKTSRSSKMDASLNMSVGFNQVADNLKGSYSNPLDQEVVSLSVSIPLVDWGVRKGRVNVAKNQLNVAQLTVQQNEQSLEEEIAMTVSDFNVQQGLISSAEDARELSDMAYEATKQRYLIGKADFNSLSLAQNRKESARKNYISALYNYWLSYYKLRKMTLYDFESQQPLSSDFETRYGIH